MARHYSALFNAKRPVDNTIDPYIKPARPDGTWSIIYKEDDEDIWYVELADAEDEETARRIADGLNLRERNRYV